VDNLPVFIEICKHVGGNPLGLELAAARLRENSLTEVADKIRTDLGCLATTQKDVPPVHRSMTAAILPSWERLDQDEQRVYARLSVFPGRFDLQAAEVVADANIAALTTFCEHSVLSGNAADGYQLPSLLRLFASIQLDRLPEEREQAEIAYRKVPAEDKRSNGVPDGLIRASVGMEASCDLPPAAPDSRLPTSDPLTRLPNRLLFEDRLDHALALSARKDRQLAVLVIEVLAGSGEEQVSAAATPMRLLPAIAIRIKETIRESDTLARIGEMTFGLILETLRDPADAQAVAEKIVNEIRKLYKLSELSQTRTLQIGISLFPADGTERERLVQAASETCESVPENAAVPIKFFGKALSGES
jgi:diguanylate cyclase (GGDEF)-like protein